jgi:hypothetical protein
MAEEVLGMVLPVEWKTPSRVADHQNEGYK